MRVDVYEARAGNAALGVDSAIRFGCRKITDDCDAALLNGDVAARKRAGRCRREAGRCRLTGRTWFFLGLIERGMTALGSDGGSIGGSAASLKLVDPPNAR